LLKLNGQELTLEDPVELRKHSAFEEHDDAEEPDHDGLEAD
jgi:hypothetical protein